MKFSADGETTLESIQEKVRMMLYTCKTSAKLRLPNIKNIRVDLKLRFSTMAISDLQMK
eukprot:gene23866-10019_t